MVEDTQKIRFRHILLALFHKLAAISIQGLSLLSIGATRFATNFLMVIKTLNMKKTLKQTMTNVEWDTYVRTLLDTQKKPVWTQA
jgi:hypothetical protein